MIFITLRRGDPFLQVGEEAPPLIFPLVFFLITLLVCCDCGFSLNADLNAARNIAWKYLAQGGMPALSGPPVNRPIVTHVEAKAS